MLTLICGIPNAGKTTFSFSFVNVIHLDDHKGTTEVCELVGGMEGSVVVEGVFGSPEKRKRLLESYKGEGSRCYFLDVPLRESIRRENRGRSRFILENAYRRFEPPTHDEGWDEIIRIENGKLHTV